MSELSLWTKSLEIGDVMIYRIVIRNKSSSELGVMLEPWTDREDVPAGMQVVINGEFSDNEILIDVSDDNFVSIWSPPGSTVSLS